MERTKSENYRDRKREDMEIDWNNGVHVTKKYGEIRIREMDTTRLQNTTNYYRRLGFNVSPLQNELNFRHL